MTQNNNIHLIIALAIILTVVGCKSTSLAKEHKLSRKITRVDFSNVKITDNFWSPRLKNHVLHTLPVCIDQIENKTERIKNFENAARRSGAHSGIFYDDSDVHKAIEGMAYSLINNPNPELKKKPMNGSINLLLHRNQMAI